MFANHTQLLPKFEYFLSPCSALFTNTVNEIYYQNFCLNDTWMIGLLTNVKCWQTELFNVDSCKHDRICKMKTDPDNMQHHEYKLEK